MPSETTKTYYALRVDAFAHPDTDEVRMSFDRASALAAASAILLALADQEKPGDPIVVPFPGAMTWLDTVEEEGVACGSTTDPYSSD